jgi:4'-phosphopantetheinyl transferase
MSVTAVLQAFPARADRAIAPSSPMLHRADMSAGDVHIWRLDLSAFKTMQGGLEGTLSEHERDRAARLRLPADRSRFIIAHGLVRRVLAGYLNEHPSAIRFVHGPYGKPSLADGSSGLRFNVSHSGGRLLIAIGSGGEIGLDIEEIDGRVGLAAMAEFFSDVEKRALAEFRESRLTASFFKCWTSKEAYLKGAGLGLTAPLGDFDVCVDPDQPARLLRPLGQHGSWFLHRIDAGSGYAAVLATTSPTTRVLMFDGGSGMAAE